MDNINTSKSKRKKKIKQIKDSVTKRNEVKEDIDVMNSRIDKLSKLLEKLETGIQKNSHEKWHREFMEIRHLLESNITKKDWEEKDKAIETMNMMHALILHNCRCINAVLKYIDKQKKSIASTKVDNGRLKSSVDTFVRQIIEHYNSVLKNTKQANVPDNTNSEKKEQTYVSVEEEILNKMEPEDIKESQIENSNAICNSMFRLYTYNTGQSLSMILKDKKQKESKKKEKNGKKTKAKKQRTQ